MKLVKSISRVLWTHDRKRARACVRRRVRCVPESSGRRLKFPIFQHGFWTWRGRRGRLCRCRLNNQNESWLLPSHSSPACFLQTNAASSYVTCDLCGKLKALNDRKLNLGLWIWTFRPGLGGSIWTWGSSDLHAQPLFSPEFCFSGFVHILPPAIGADCRWVKILNGVIID